jgi:V/A-type H+/Na+-transporting ATPase subunit A
LLGNIKQVLKLTKPLAWLWVRLQKLFMLRITAISGPLVQAQMEDKSDSPRLLETVYVGKARLLGEVITIHKDTCKIQVYEETTGLQVGEPVELKGELLSVELGPGMIGTIFDGIQRPLEALDEVSPIFIQPGIHLPSLNQTKKWDFIPTVQAQEEVSEGMPLGYVQETELLKHWVLVPVALTGKVAKISAGNYTIKDEIAQIKDAQGQIHSISMSQKWPVKKARPVVTKLPPKKIFKTGQRVIDAMFPIMLGAPVSTPGPFGAGKTFTQQQLAKWGDAQIVVYVGCGERGNEMTEMVKLFPTLNDPRTDRPLMERTILIANTSNMPIAAREASIYTGITIAEYFRDMGYDVVLMADSTSRWAESMREISARLGEMPSEEGYPAYLSSRVAAFYERAGVVQTLSGQEGSVTVIGTVSPAGGDFSEPMTQASLKSTQVFLALDEKLASRRHYPAINWQTSYSLYEDIFNSITSKGENGAQFVQNRLLAKQILAKEETLIEMVKLVGTDGLDNGDRLVLEIAKSLREDFLQQNGFDPIDTYSSFEKTQAILGAVLDVYRAVLNAIESQLDMENLVADIFDAELKNILANLKYQNSALEVSEAANQLISTKIIKQPLEV